LHAPGERCRAGWASAPGPVHMPRMNALARLRPGSSDCLPAGVARQRKGTKRIMAPAAQGPRPSAVHLPRHAAIPFAPCTGADAETPLTTSQLFTGALDQRGEGMKNRGFRRQSRPDRILPTAGQKDPRAAFPGHGLHRLPGACVAAGIDFNASPPASSQNRCDRSSGGSCRRRCRCFRP
jgi:hypothetical protein